LNLLLRVLEFSTWTSAWTDLDESPLTLANAIVLSGGLFFFFFRAQAVVVGDPLMMVDLRSLLETESNQKWNK